MTEAIVKYLPWALSAISILVQYLAGNKNKLAWIISIPLQGVWILWIILSENWGFIPLNICMTIVSIRNLIKWWLEDSDVDSYIPYEDVDTSH